MTRQWLIASGPLPWELCGGWARRAPYTQESRSWWHHMLFAGSESVTWNDRNGSKTMCISHDKFDYKAPKALSAAKICSSSVLETLVLNEVCLVTLLFAQSIRWIPASHAVSPRLDWQQLIHVATSHDVFDQCPIAVVLVATRGVELTQIQHWS